MAVAMPAEAVASDRIVFVRERLGSFGKDLYSVRADGTDLKRLTTDGGSYSPQWSPDGQWIVFESGETLQIMRADGSDRRQLTPDSGSYAWQGSPSFAPDAKSIVFHGGVASLVNGLYVMQSKCTNVRALTRPPGESRDLSPRWSPDGSRVAFLRAVSSDDPTSLFDDVFTVRPDGSGVTNVSKTRGLSERYSSWSPDGARLVVDAGGFLATEPRIYTMAADGTDVRPVVTYPDDGNAPAYGPDGSTIVYGTHGGLKVMNSDGTNQRQLTTGLYDSWPAWRPPPGGPATPDYTTLARVSTTTSLVKLKATVNPCQGLASLVDVSTG